MQKELRLRKDIYLPKKENKLLKNLGQYEKGLIFLEIIDELTLILKIYISPKKDNKLLMN